MRVAILETGGPPPSIEARFGRYPAMFEALLTDGERRFETYRVNEGQYPESMDAIIVTGAPAGVYDALPWIASLRAFLRQARGIPMVGVCFGHQIMAEAFGGRVLKHPGGWGIGLHRYQVVARQPWMDAVPDFTIPASHQDQVIIQPPASEVVASSTFTPYAALAYTDQPAISFQGHPEFTPAVSSALIELGRGRRYDDAFAELGLRSLREPNDCGRVAGWIGAFLTRTSEP